MSEEQDIMRTIPLHLTLLEVFCIHGRERPDPRDLWEIAGKPESVHISQDTLGQFINKESVPEGKVTFEDWFFALPLVERLAILAKFRVMTSNALMKEMGTKPADA